MKIDKKIVWLVWSNTDLCEGKGQPYVRHVCESEATAIRMAHKNFIQGTDAPTEKYESLRFDGGKWLAPYNLLRSTSEDRRSQTKIDNANYLKEEKEVIMNKMLDAGFTEADIKKLKEK